MMGSQDDREVLRPTLNLSRCRRGRDDNDKKKQPLKLAPTKAPKRRKRPRTSSTKNPKDWKLHIPSFRIDPELERLEKEFLDEDYEEEPPKPKKLPPIPNFSMDEKTTFSDDSEDDDFLLQVPTFSKSHLKRPIAKTTTTATTKKKKETMKMTTAKRKSGKGVVSKPKPSNINKKNGAKLSPVVEEEVEEDPAGDPFESSEHIEFDYLLPDEDPSEPEESEPSKDESNKTSVMLSLEIHNPSPCKDTLSISVDNYCAASTKESEKDGGASMNGSAVNGDTTVEQLVQPAVPSETTNSDSSSSDMAAPPGSNDKSKETVPVDADQKHAENDKMALTIAVDHLFCKSDKITVTLKAFRNTLEENLVTKLGKEAKKLVRRRLVDLIAGRIQPTKPSEGVTPRQSTKPSEGVTPSAGDKKAAAVSASKQDKNSDNIPPSHPTKKSTESKRQNTTVQAHTLSTESNLKRPKKANAPVVPTVKVSTCEEDNNKERRPPVQRKRKSSTEPKKRRKSSDQTALVSIESNLESPNESNESEVATKVEASPSAAAAEPQSNQDKPTEDDKPEKGGSKPRKTETEVSKAKNSSKTLAEDRTLVNVSDFADKEVSDDEDVKSSKKRRKSSDQTALVSIESNLEPPKESNDSEVAPKVKESPSAAVAEPQSKQDKPTEDDKPEKGNIKPKKSKTEVSKADNSSKTLAEDRTLVNVSDFADKEVSDDEDVKSSKKRRKSSDQTALVSIESNLEPPKESNNSEVAPKVKESPSAAVAEPQSNQDKPTEDDKPEKGNIKPKKSKTEVSMANNSSKTLAEDRTLVNVSDFADKEVSDVEDVSLLKQTAIATEKGSNSKSKKLKEVPKKSTNDSSKESNDHELESKKGKTQAKPPRNKQKVGDENGPSEVVEVSKSAVDAVPPRRAKRGRPPKSKPQAVSDASAELEEKTVAQAKAASTSVRPSSRKRARKGSCALCTTCPCQNSHEHDDHTMFDFKSMSRSDGAVEKALIRRVQKLEKSTENLEEQAEAVRRKLKKHRRDMWRKKEKVLQARSKTFTTEESRFLPDEEEFEAQQTETQKLHNRVVKQAARIMFATAPGELLLLFFCMYHVTRFIVSLKLFLLKEYQPTLTQLFGCPSKKAAESKDNQDADVGVLEETKTSDPEEDLMSISSEPPTPEDDLGPLEYVKSPEVEGKIHRVEWRQGSSANNFVGSQVVRGPSAWGALTTIAEEGNYDLSAEDSFFNVGNNDNFGSAWDRLFTDEKEVNDGGMDHLLGLLQTQAGGLSQIPEASQNETILASQGAPINLFMLSQGRQSLAVEIEENVSSNKEKLAALQKACPNWKENVTYALHQQDEDHVREALEKVRESRGRMAETKRKIFEAWERQQVALDVFETALHASLTRIKVPRGVAQPEPVEAEGGYLTALSPDKGHDDICDWVANEDATTSCIELYVSPTKCSREKDNASMESSTTCLDFGLALSY
jgi:hypothetical protein